MKHKWTWASTPTPTWYGGVFFLFMRTLLGRMLPGRPLRGRMLPGRTHRGRMLPGRPLRGRMMPGRTLLRGIFLGGMIILGLAAGCSSERAEQQRGETTQLIDPENALSEELMVSLGQAQNFHHKANVFLDDGKVELAAAEVEKILAIPFPKNSPEAQDVVLDTRARLAKLWLMLGRMDEAMNLVNEGLASDSRRSFFLANLHTVRGQIFEAKATEAAADSPAKTDAIRQAIEAFDTSIEINNELLEKLNTRTHP